MTVSSGLPLLDDARLARQLDFLIAVDALKRVQRASPTTCGTRRENSAEHSWHVALCARVLAEHADAPVDLERVTAMLLVHDIVEIDAGDTPLHGPADPTVAARERAAAERLFGLLPADQGRTLRTLWDAFDAGEDADARYARAIDRLQPVLLNAVCDGGTWVDFAVTRAGLTGRVRHIADGSARLWAYCEALIEHGVERGWIAADR